MLEVGLSAPDFLLPTDNRGDVRLSKLRGQPVVVYFYPKDDTAGCTKEAQAFSDLAADFAKLGARVIGISPDSIAKHAKFRVKYDLAIDLAADEDKKVASDYGVWVEKSMYGRSYMGIERTTFLIDERGKIARLWRKVKVPGHAEEVLAATGSLATK